jgi:DNA replication and repair protein RecF
MYLNRVEVRHFRNLTSVSLSPAPGLNILEGSNASGKTSFLEAVFMLGMARSFRTIKTKQVVQYGSDDLLIFAELQDGQSHRLGLQRFTDNRIAIRLDGANLQGRSELVQLLPLQLVTPETLSLLTGSPNERRQYLDWLLFHVEPNFHEQWKRYQRALKQRNALLRENRAAELPYWTQALAKEGEALSCYRRELISEITPIISEYLSHLMSEHALRVEYRQGWKSGQALDDSLSASVENDLKNKYTSVGPHRADLIIYGGEQRVSDSFSRGQLKLVLCALKLAQLELIKQKTGKTAVVLMDDLPAELDVNHRQTLLRLLHELNSQVFVTTTDRSHLEFSAWSDVKVFHVEHGNIQEVV